MRGAGEYRVQKAVAVSGVARGGLEQRGEERDTHGYISGGSSGIVLFSELTGRVAPHHSHGSCASAVIVGICVSAVSVGSCERADRRQLCVSSVHRQLYVIVSSRIVGSCERPDRRQLYVIVSGQIVISCASAVSVGSCTSS